jgi:hypothetical protein
MMIKDLGPRVESVWEGLRPRTKNMLVGALQSNISPANPPQKFFYDTHSDWELSRLLTALDEQSRSPEAPKSEDSRDEIAKLAETCVSVLETQTGSAEVFIQLATRALDRRDYEKLDRLSDRLPDQFSAAEIAEVVRQTELAQIRAIAYETLSMLPAGVLANLLDDPLYADIAANALEQKAYEYDSEEARDILDNYEGGFGGEFEN